MSAVRVRRAPARPGRAVVHVPGSKSIANRSLICAALATGESTLTNLPDGDDTTLMVEALAVLGAPVRHLDDGVVVGGPLDRGPTSVRVDAGLGGTTARFLCAVAAVRSGTTVITGGTRLLERPMAPLLRALRDLGASVEDGGSDGVLAAISGGELRGGTLEMSADVSSQFVSALMLIGPLMRDGVTISLTGPQRSRTYLEMTAEVMRSFGVSVETGSRTIDVRPGQYSPRRIEVEADFSSAAFPVMAAALTRRALVIPGVSSRSIQGDRRLIDIARAMSCDVSTSEDGLHVDPRNGDDYPGAILDLTNESDLVPALVVGLLGATSRSTIQGVGFIREKESNRLEDFSSELGKCGLDVVPTSDGLTIMPGLPHAGAVLEPMDDHRLAMAFGLVPLLCADLDDPLATVGPCDVVVRNPETVSKSWPGYWSDMASFLDVEWLPS